MSQNIQYSSTDIPGIEALSCTGSFAFGKHIHDGHVLWLNSNGGEKYSLRGSSAVLQQGSISIIEPGIAHSNSPVKNSNRHLRSLYLEESFFSYLAGLFSGYKAKHTNLPTITIDNKHCWQQALYLHDAIINHHDKMNIEERILSLFAGLNSCAQLIKSTEKKPDRSTERLQLVLDYLQESKDNNLSLGKLATVASCTSFHLIRLFKQHFGISPHAYMIQFRLEKAKKLLDTGHQIIDAALLSGFSDQSHLTRNFKKRYGITPGMYSQQK